MARKKKRRPNVECAFCGVVGECTDDHVPPKALFREPRPNNLITVPACRDCNNRRSIDDDYFRNQLVKRHDVAANPSAQDGFEAHLRGMARPQQRRALNSMLQSIFPVELVTKSGLFAGIGYAYEVDQERMNDYVARITQGLFFHENKRRLPDGYRTKACLAAHIEPDGVWLKALGKLRNAAWKKIGDAFQYAVISIEGDPNLTVWLHVYYEAVPFIAMTVPVGVFLQADG